MDVKGMGIELGKGSLVLGEGGIVYYTKKRNGAATLSTAYASHKPCAKANAERKI